MTKKTYSELLKDPRWQKKRLQVFERDNWECIVCGNNTETLHVHHKTYKGAPWDVPLEKLETLCHRCHEKKHTYQSFNISKPKIVTITPEDLNKVDFNTGYNPFDIPASLIWDYKQVLFYKNEFNQKTTERISLIEVSREEMLEYCEEKLDEACYKYNFQLVTDYGIYAGIEYIN